MIFDNNFYSFPHLGRHTLVYQPGLSFDKLYLHLNEKKAIFFIKYHDLFVIVSHCNEANETFLFPDFI